MSLINFVEDMGWLLGEPISASIPLMSLYIPGAMAESISPGCIGYFWIPTPEDKRGGGGGTPYLYYEYIL